MSSTQFSFKSSGFKSNDRKFEQIKTQERPIGFVTPLVLEDNTFKMHVNPIKQLSDNFRNLLMTNNGERLGRYSYGANLNSILFEYGNNQNLESIISEIINEMTQKYIPSIIINSIEVYQTELEEKNSANSLGLAKFVIRINYSIPKFKSPNLGIEIDFMIGG